MEENRAVITGVGVIAPNGIGKDEFWQALKDGRSGIKPIKRFDTQEFKCKLAGEIDDFKPADFLGAKGLRDLDRSTRLLCSAAKLAIEDAKLDISDRNTDEIGVSTGTTLSSLWGMAEYDKQIVKDGPLFTDVGIFPETVINAASSYVSIRFNIQGFNTTVSTGYTSSLDALKYALDFIRLGRVKAVLVGGVESISLANFTGFYQLGFLAGLKGEETSCPFDKRRNGIILSEGAGVIIIEDEKYARLRKARVYGQVRGISSVFDAYKIGKYRPEPKGLKATMEKALGESQLEPKQIDYINASANSVSQQDKLETKAIRGVFGKSADKIPVTSIKSMIGESFSASGIFQIACAVGSLMNNFIPPIINYKVPDEDCDLSYVKNNSLTVKVNNILINNFGPGGNNASLVISRFK